MNRAGPTVRSRRLSAQLRVYRETAHLDQTRVAGAIGIKQAHMSSIENGRSKISAENLATLSDPKLRSTGCSP